MMGVGVVRGLDAFARCDYKFKVVRHPRPQQRRIARRVTAPPPATKPPPSFLQKTLCDLRALIASGLPASAKLLDLKVDSGPQQGLQRRLAQAHYEALRPLLRIDVRSEELATGFSGNLLMRFGATALGRTAPSETGFTRI